MLFLFSCLQITLCSVLVLGATIDVTVTRDTTAGSLQERLAAEFGLPRAGLEVDGNITISGGGTGIPAPAISFAPPLEPFTVKPGSELTFSRIALQSSSLSPVPSAVPLNVTLLRQSLLPVPQTAPDFLKPTWVEIQKDGRLTLENVEVVTDCETLISYHNYICSGAWTSTLRTDDNGIYVDEWRSEGFAAFNVSIHCTRPGLLQSCRVVQPRNVTEFRGAFQLQLPLVVVVMVANMSLTDDGVWSHDSLPVQVETAVLLQGLPNRLSVLDVQNRQSLFNISTTGLFGLVRVHLINAPLGPPDMVPTCWCLTSPWYLNYSFTDVGPFVYYQDSTGDYPKDLLEYYALYLGMLLSPVPYIRQKALWFAPYIENYTISPSQASLVVRSYVNQYAAVINATMKTGPDAVLPLQIPYTGVLDFTNNGAIPLTQVFGVTTPGQLLSSLNNAQAAVGWVNDQYVLVLLNNITVSATDQWPSRGVLINRTVTISRYAYFNTAMDFQGSSNVFLLTRGLRLQLRNIILINLPTLPVTQQRYGLFSSGMWAFSYDRSAASTLNLVNITMAVSDAELAFMSEAITSGLLNAKVEDQSNTTVQLSVLDGFGYDSSNITLTTEPGDGFVLSPTNITYDSFKQAYHSTVSPTPPSKGSSSSSSMPAWQIAVVVVGCVVGVSVIVAGLLLLLSRKPPKDVADPEQGLEQQYAGPPTTKDSDKTGSRDWQAGSQSNLKSDQLDDGSNPALEIQLTVAALNAKIDDVQLSIHELLGRGAYGEVYRGHWRNLDVAVKIMNINEQDDSVRQCASQEVAVLVNMVHPNVVTTFSYDLQVVPVQPQAQPSSRQQVSSSGSNPPGDGRQSNESNQGPKRWKLFIIQEFCYGGPLRGAIDGQLFRKVDTGEVDLNKVLASAVDIGKGMQHVHSKNIIHGDLNPNNVLLQINNKSCYGHVSKVADFGLSVTMDANQTHVSNLHRGTMFYAAPEVVLDGCLTKFADVFAYGVILWELYHGTPPWRKKRMRPLLNPAALFEYDPQCPQEYKELCQRCLSLEKNDRPTFDESLAILTALQQKLGCEVAETSTNSVQMPVPQMTPSQQQALRTLAPDMFESSSGNTINIYYNNSTQEFSGQNV